MSDDVTEDLWSSKDDDARAARIDLAGMKETHNQLAQYLNGRRRVLQGDPYSGMTVARQLSLAEQLGRIAEALWQEGVARNEAVDKFGMPVLTLLAASHKGDPVPYDVMVEKWGVSDDLTRTLREFLREGLIDFVRHGQVAAYLITDVGKVRLTRASVAASPERGPAVGGGSDV